MTIHVQNKGHYPVVAERLRAAALAVLAAHDAAPACSLTIVLTDDATVRQLNQQYRGVDAPTDVLSFPAVSPVRGRAAYLGDLIIAFPYALAQAQRQQHAPLDSLALLVVHGTLHLLGYDHDTPARRAAMWAAQAAALRQLGIDETIVPDLEGAAPHADTPAHEESKADDETPL